MLLVVGVPGGWRYGGPYVGGGVGLVVSFSSFGANWPTMRGRLANPGPDREECRRGGPSKGRREGDRRKTSGIRFGAARVGRCAVVESASVPYEPHRPTARRSHAPIRHVDRVLDAPAIPHPRPNHGWDPITRLLKIGGRRLRVAPMVSVFGALTGHPGHGQRPRGRLERPMDRDQTSRSTEWPPRDLAKRAMVVVPAPGLLGPRAPASRPR